MNTNSLIDLLDEQSLVGFTGKVNILDKNSKQFLGMIVFFEGDIYHASFKGILSFKGLCQILIAEEEASDFLPVVEPEIVDEASRSIHFPYNILKKRLMDTIEEYRLSRENRPPNSLKLMVKPEFLESQEKVSGNEFKLLATISDYNLVKDIYEKSSLLDYEITNALVSLRKKNALSVIKG